MKISLEVITMLIKLIKQLEKLETILTWHENSDIYRQQIIDNELYYTLKIKNNEIKKIKYFEEKILKEQDKFQNLLYKSYDKVQINEIGPNLSIDLQRELGYENYNVKIFKNIKQSKLIL